MKTSALLSTISIFEKKYANNLKKIPVITHIFREGYNSIYSSPPSYLKDIQVWEITESRESTTSVYFLYQEIKKSDKIAFVSKKDSKIYIPLFTGFCKDQDDLPYLHIELIDLDKSIDDDKYYNDADAYLSHIEEISVDTL